MKQQLKAFWAFLDGKKTAIAAAYWGIVCPSLIALYPSGVPVNINKWVTVVGIIFTTLGLGHKVVKSTGE